MREFTVRATGAIFVATALHAIAMGTCCPPSHPSRRPEPLMTICVDQTEFIVTSCATAAPTRPTVGHQRAGLHARAASLRGEMPPVLNPRSRAGRLGATAEALRPNSGTAPWTASGCSGPCAPGPAVRDRHSVPGRRDPADLPRVTAAREGRQRGGSSGASTRSAPGRSPPSRSCSRWSPRGASRTSPGPDRRVALVPACERIAR